MLVLCSDTQRFPAAPPCASTCGAGTPRPWMGPRSIPLGKVREKSASLTGTASETAVSSGAQNKDVIEKASQKEGKVRKQELQLRSK